MRRYFERVETMDREELAKIQRKRLRWTINHAFKNSFFYNRKLKEAKISPNDIKELKDIQKLPFTSGEEMLNHASEMIAIPQKHIAFIGTSSGTTANLRRFKRVFFSKKDWDTHANIMARSGYAHGIRKEDIVVPILAFGPFASTLILTEGAKKLGCALFPLDICMLDIAPLMIRDSGASVIITFPPYLVRLGELLQKQGITMEALNLKLLSTGGGLLPNSLRRRIENMFEGVKLYSIYGQAESGACLASECFQRHGYHIWADHFLVEIIDPTTREPVNEGEKGELVFTTLTREGTPLLRYTTRDLALLLGDDCACGRIHPLIEIMGRVDQMVIVGSTHVHSLMIKEVLFSVPSIKNFEVVVEKQGTKDILTIEMELKEGFEENENLLQTVKNSVIDYCPELKVDLENGLVDIYTRFVSYIQNPNRIVDKRVWQLKG